MASTFGSARQVQGMRDELAEQVAGPGKFEGEAIYSPYFYGRLLDGDGMMIDAHNDEPVDEPAIGDDEAFDDMMDESQPGDFAWVLDINDDERQAFPELGDAQTATVYEDSVGFVYVSLDAERKG